MKLKLWHVVVLGPILIIGIALGYYWVVAQLFPANYSNRGLFGDSFGLLNAIFTGLAFAGLIYTIISQQDEINETRKTLHRDRFETTFFHLVDQYNNLDKTFFSGHVIKYFQDEPFKLIPSFPGILNEYRAFKHPSHDGKSKISLAYLMEDTFRPHLRVFETIVEFINSYPHESSQERFKYYRFFFCRLTNFELILFFYHFNFRYNEFPKGFAEYRNELFNTLHTSPLMPTGHYMAIANTSIKEKPE